MSVLACTDILEPASFGDALRARRRRAGLSQTRLAEITGISRAHICNIENGRADESRPVYRYALRCALGLPEDADDGWWRVDW